MNFSWIPNGLCVLRMLLAFPIAWLLLHDQFWLTFGVFFIAAVTDALDGFIAKRCHWTSELGKILDPLADKLLLVTVFIALAMIARVPLWLAALVVVRDMVITAGAITYRVIYGPLVDAAPTLVSKLNTLVQIIYVLGVMSAALIAWPGVQLLNSWAWVVALTTLVSGVDYVVTYSRRAAAMRRARRQPSRESL
jgi:cardiolipin synthase